MSKEIKGISCEVKNCIYHDVTDCCNAGAIKVGCPSAKNVQDTVCETFKCCENCEMR